MRITQVSRIALLLLILSVLFGAISLWIVRYVDTVDSDFFSFWLAGQVVQQGQSPYDVKVWIEGHQNHHADWISDPTFLYPLPFAIVMVPLSQLALPVAYAIWVSISQWILFGSTIWLLRLFRDKARFFILPVFAGLALFRPVFPLLLNGQIASLLLLWVLLSLALFVRQRTFGAGLMLSLVVLKPNLGVPILGLVSLYLLLSRQFRGLLGIGVGLLILLGISLFVQPDWIRAYADVLLYKQTSTFGYTPTLWGLVYFLTGMNRELSLWIGALLCLFVVGVFIVVISQRDVDYDGVFSLATSLAVLMTPYLWPYDQILLIIPIIFIMACMAQARWPFLISALFFLIVDVIYWLILWLSLTIERENFGALIPLVLSVLLFLVLFRKPRLAF